MSGESSLDRLTDTIACIDLFSTGVSFNLGKGKQKQATLCGLLFSFLMYYEVAMFGLVKFDRMFNYKDNTHNVSYDKTHN